MQEVEQETVGDTQNKKMKMLSKVTATVPLMSTGNRTRNCSCQPEQKNTEKISEVTATSLTLFPVTFNDVQASAVVIWC